MEKRMIDAALRQQIAQWTRAALGQLVEDDRTMESAGPNLEQTACCLAGSGQAVQGQAFCGIVEEEVLAEDPAPK